MRIAGRRVMAMAVAVAMALLLTAAWLGVLSNPEKSTVTDKLGFVHVPTVPGKPALANLWSWNMAISILLWWMAE